MEKTLPLESLEAFSEASQPTPSDAALNSISVLAEMQTNLEDDIEALEKDLKTKKEALRQVAEVLLPGAMIEAGCEAYRTSDGHSIEVKNFVSASLPKDSVSREKAFEWLDVAGHADIVKNSVSLMFTRGEDADAKKAYAILLQNGFVPEKSQTIHPMTLKAFIKEQLENGTNIPLDLFNAYLGRRAKILRKES